MVTATNYNTGTWATPDGVDYCEPGVTDISVEAYEQLREMFMWYAPVHLRVVPKIAEDPCGFIHDLLGWRPKPLLVCEAPPGARRVYQPRTAISLCQKYRQKRKMRLQSL